MISEEKIIKLASEKLEELSIFIVDIQTNTQNKIKVLLDSEKGVTIKDCVEISRAIEHNLDREIEDFELEVSSYGLFSPLILPLQFKKNMNKEVNVKKKDGIVEKGILSNIEFSDDEKSVESIELKQIKKINIKGKKKKSIIEEAVKITIQEINEIILVSAF
ncbi:MAG: ribosome assembly cofactor RimP [Bacteroidales bacterium]|nr:ribosome assembly cofactor RimP [Bacteroidales bacterium]MBN2757758.1 ribosome assembly cofactor RimP [Bacteroidales bacterium]